ncbi:MAG: serine protease [Deltaproteobacteria bacterium]|nr:serine protease [Deltaproteobacteria bacterium]
MKKLIFAVLLLILHGCVANNASNISQKKIVINNTKTQAHISDNDEYEKRNYSAFDDQGDHFEELVRNGFFKKAAALYEDHLYLYFTKKAVFSKRLNKEKHQKAIDIVANHLNTIYSEKIHHAVSKIKSHNITPFPVEEWGTIKVDINRAKEIIVSYNSYSIIADDANKLEKIKNLENSIQALKEILKNSAPDAFSRFPIFSDKEFFIDYPHEISDKNSFVINNFALILPKLEKAECKSLEQFNTIYSKYCNDEIKDIIANLYLSHILPSFKKNPKSICLKDIISALKVLQDNGFMIKNYKNQNVVFVEATSKTLLKEGYIEFPSEVDIDLPFDYKTCSLEKVFTDNPTSTFIVVFDIAQANVKRRILKKDDIKSMFLNGYKSVDNPGYRSAFLAMTEAQRGLTSANYTNCNSTNVWVTLACEIAKGAAVSGWQNKVNAANQEYVATSPTKQQEIHTNYHFSVSNVDVTKVMTVNYYILDRINKKYFKSSFDVNEQKSFRLAYNLKDEDINRSAHLSNYNSEPDIELFEKNPVLIKLSDLMQNYIKNINQTKNLVCENDLRKIMLEDKNKSLADYKKNTYETKSLDDPRFNNVVVIYNPQQKLGTGFFVAPNYVLTNYHVIEGAKFFEMKLYNGLETFGKVIKSDVRLDLALLKVEARGEPVKFFNLKTIKLGAEVEAIGHPKGLEFSITRGVISALRKQKSVYDIGGKDILFIQTDAAINPGNSGGPLFYGDKVVGINNQKIVANVVEGLGFAIHFSEAKKFLEESF